MDLLKSYHTLAPQYFEIGEGSCHTPEIETNWIFTDYIRNQIGSQESCIQKCSITKRCLYAIVDKNWCFLSSNESCYPSKFDDYPRLRTFFRAPTG